ncbi:MAG TPA: hypothetical protein VGR64_05925 [Terracidiphilus sp.]|nr:hypothetical protein [Terracidiphilus sp.]
MSGTERNKANPETPRVEAQAMLEPELREALDHFKAGVHAWSRAMEARSKQAFVAQPVRRGVWRLAAAWSLGLVLTAGAASCVLYQRRQQQELARMEQQRIAAQQAQMTRQREQAEENLLANVESDVSREVPSAMEPLARLMTSDGTEVASAAQ